MSDWDVQAENPLPDEWSVASTSPDKGVAAQKIATSGLPSVMDRLIASPVGRFAQQNIVGPALNFAAEAPHVQGEILSAGGILPNPLSDMNEWLAQKAAGLSGAENKGYEAALARNRNTPGYAEALKEAQKVTAPAGATSMLTAPFNESVAGLAALLTHPLAPSGGLDYANAASDVVAQNQAKYAQQNPVSSFFLPLVGGLAAAPESGLKVPALPTTKTAMVPATTPQETTAAKYLGNLVRASSKTPDEIAAYGTAASGKPVLGAEALGRPGVTMLSSLGRRTGATPDILEGTLSTRAAEAPTRMLQDFADAVGVEPEAASGNIQSIVDRGRQLAKPLYQEAYSQPMPVTQSLRDIAKRPSIKPAMTQAVKMILDAGGNPKDFGFMRVGEGPVPESGFSETANGYVPVQPTTEAWDLVKRALDGRVQSNLDPVTGRAKNPALGHSLNNLSNDLRGVLRENNPAYANALDHSSDYLSAQSAFQKGAKNILNGAVTEKQFADMLPKGAAQTVANQTLPTVAGEGNLPNGDFDAFRAGIANKLWDMAQNNRLRPTMLQVPRVQSKLASVFGPDRAAKFLDRLRIESDMAKYGARMKPGIGSQTGELNAMLGEQDNGIPAEVAGRAAMAGYEAIRGNPLGALWHGKEGLKNYLASKSMSVPVRDEIGRLLMMPPEDLASYIRTSPKANAAPIMSLPKGPAPVPFGLIPPVTSYSGGQ